MQLAPILNIKINVGTVMKQLNKTSVAAAVGAVAVGSVMMMPAQAETSPFGLTDLVAGYQVAAPEGSCGGKDKKEGSCGEGSCGGKDKKEASCGEGSCGGKDKKEGSCGEGSCGGKDKKEASCGEGSCGGKDKKEASCGEGACGGK